MRARGLVALLVLAAACERGGASGTGASGTAASGGSTAASARDAAVARSSTTTVVRSSTVGVQHVTDLLPSDGEAHRILIERCAICHGLEHVAQQRIPLAKWTATIEKMAKWGAPLADGEAATLAAALASALPPSLPDVAPRRVPTPLGARAPSPSP